MRNIFYMLLAISLTTSCTNNKKRVLVRSTSDFKVIKDEKLTSNPRSIYLLGDNIAWFDSGTLGNFIHCFNKNSGDDIGSYGNIGYNKDEFINPFIRYSWNNNLFVDDYEIKNRRYFNIEHENKNKGAFRKPSKEDSIMRLKNYDIKIDDNFYFGYNMDREDEAFKFHSNGIKNTFGKYIFEKQKVHFHPLPMYNKEKKILVMGSNAVNYFAGYKYDNDNFELLWEVRENYRYEIKNGYVYVSVYKHGSYGMTLTKDYIISIQRDYENDTMGENIARKDYSKWPTTLFVYDYSGVLVKIINYNTPIKSITGDINSNNIYALYGYPDYKVGVSLID